MAEWPGFSYLVTSLARCVRDGEVAFSGVNSTPAMLACMLAKRSGRDFTWINVAGGVDPEPEAAPLSSSDPALTRGSASVFANEDFYDLCTRGRMDLCFLGAAQVDGAGRINTSVIGAWSRPRVRLPGGGGAAVMLPTARRTVTWRTEHSTRVLVERLDFVTAGGGVAALVTPLAVFARHDGALALQAWHPATDPEAIAARTGFPLRLAPDAAPSPPPSAAEASALAAIDPDGHFARDSHVVD